MKLQELVHTALDELRMEMLGVQVLFGFQMNGVFQDAFAYAPRDVRIADGLALDFLVLTLGLLIAGPAIHRLAEQGNATVRMFRLAKRFAALSLATFLVAIGLDIYVVVNPFAGATGAAVSAVAATLAALVLWFGLGLGLRPFMSGRKKPMPKQQPTELHEKIDQMLTEARVVLPGAQALLGFQFIVTMSKAFHDLPGNVQLVHFVAFASVLLSVMLLIAPAAVHRLTFGGMDDERVHDIGSTLVTCALVPLALGIAGDVYVALFQNLGSAVALPQGLIGLGSLLTLWYVLPLVLRSARGRA